MGRDAHAVLKTVKQHADLRFSDGRDHRLAGILVAGDLEGWVGIGGLLKEGVELALGAASVGLDGGAVQRVGEAEGRGLDLAGDAQGVAGLGLKLGHDHDIARGGLGNVLGLFAAHEVEVAQALGLAGAGVGELQTRGDGARQDLEEGKTAVLRVVQRLEGKDNRAVVVCRDVQLLAVDQRDAAKVGHRGEPRHNGVHKRDDALFTHATTCENRDKHALGDCLGEKTLKLVLGDLAAFQVLHHDLVVSLDHKLGELSAGRLGGTDELGRDIGHHGLAVLEVAGRHVHDVDDARESVTRAHGDGDSGQLGAKALLQRGKGHLVIGVGAVNAVDKDGACETLLLGGKPQAGRNGAGARRRVDHKQGRLAGTHCRVGVAHKVGVARSVQHVYAGALPLDGRDGGRDRESALALLAVVIKRGLCAGVAA